MSHLSSFVLSFLTAAVTQTFLPLLRKAKCGGMIINNASISSVTPSPMEGIYMMSNAATAMVTDSLRLELAPLASRRSI
jgi:1-acylglycerone phosphate reductase